MLLDLIDGKNSSKNYTNGQDAYVSDLAAQFNMKKDFICWSQ